MNRLAVAFTIIGFVLLVGGVAVVFWPAALMLAGLVLCWAGLFAVDVDRGTK